MTEIPTNDVMAFGKYAQGVSPRARTAIALLVLAAATGLGQAGPPAHREPPLVFGIAFPFGSHANSFIEADLRAGKLSLAVHALRKLNAKLGGAAYARQIYYGQFLLGRKRQRSFYAARSILGGPHEGGAAGLALLQSVSEGKVNIKALALVRRSVAEVSEVSFGNGFDGGDVVREGNDLLPKESDLNAAGFIACLDGAFDNQLNYFSVLLAKKAVSYEPLNPLGNYILGYFYTNEHQFKKGVRYLELALTENPGRFTRCVKAKLAEALKNARSEQLAPSR